MRRASVFKRCVQRFDLILDFPTELWTKVCLSVRRCQLEAGERYNLEHISRLEIENQSICLQHRLQERKEKKLILENESMATKMVSQTYFMREFDVVKRQLEKTVSEQTTKALG